MTTHDCEKYFPSIKILVLCWETFNSLSRSVTLNTGSQLFGKVIEDYGLREWNGIHQAKH